MLLVVAGALLMRLPWQLVMPVLLWMLKQRLC